jgi:thiol:disulfide interchange protein
MRRSHSAARVGLLVVLVLAVAPILAVPPKDIKETKDAVKITATADKPDEKGNQTVTITLEITKPWHLYANPVGQDDLASAQTVVSFKGKTKPEVVKIEYPAGKVEVDKDIGNYKIYEDKVVIKANVRRAKDDTSPLKVAIQMQACDKSSCLMPSTVEVEAETK